MRERQKVLTMNREQPANALWIPQPDVSRRARFGRGEKRFETLRGAVVKTIADGRVVHAE